MIFPSAGDELDLLRLAGIYAYPRDSWLRANMVTSADGAAYVDGRSTGLSSPDDKRIFGVLRALADVILVGAGTARAEEYRPALRRPSLASLREGRPQTPPIALVTRSLGLNLASSLFTDTPPDARTIVITCAASDAGLRAETAKVADVIVAGEESVDLAAALKELKARAMSRVLCEGGPHLLGDLAAAGLLTNSACRSARPWPARARAASSPASRSRPAR